MDQAAGIWSRCLEYAALSDVGLRRANNQDSYKVVPAGNQADFEQRGHLFIVADGMGAHAAGELASKMAADIIALNYCKSLEQSPPEAILSSVLDTNNQIHTRGQASPDFRGMGTTATSLLLLPTGALVAHVGDSRAYRVRDNRIEQLTFDHSLVWEMQASGQFPDGQLPSYVTKNIITRSLGPNSAVQVDLEGPHPLQVGDTFLLCSDGLSNQVADDEIGLVLSCLSPTDAVQALIDLACLRGGPDNITAIVVRVVGPQVAETTDSGQPASSAKPNPRPAHPILWTLLGIASLATVGLVAVGQPLMAAAGLFVALATLAAALRQRYGSKNASSEPDNRSFGRGPYVACDCSLNANLLGRLAELARQVQEAAMDEHVAVDHSQFDTLLAEAAEAAKAGDLIDAARKHLLAITSLMAQLRQRSTTPGDSGVFL